MWALAMLAFIIMFSYMFRVAGMNEERMKPKCDVHKWEYENGKLRCGFCKRWAGNEESN